MRVPEILDLAETRRIAYHRLSASGDGAKLPGVVFLAGFRSDMTGTKALFLEEWARARGRAFVRFDYRGHGMSSADFTDGCIGDWADDAAEVLKQLCEGPQILVGSSMGGWIALLLARRMPERIAGLVGIAAAPDFTEDGIWARLDDRLRDALFRDSRITVSSEYDPNGYVITRHLIEEGRDHLVLRAPLFVPGPVRLLHGTADADVEMSVALRLLDHVDGPDTRLTLVKEADHRFSGQRELALIGKTLHGLSRAIEPSGAR
jgi:pimeloyl-ACP methyl ester carboxylesterase